jgi:hypothetical protein
MSDVPIEILKKRLWSGRVKDLVARICTDYPSCKGNYGLLLWRVYRQLGINNLHDFFENINRLPSPETIGRRFRELQAADPENFAPSVSTATKRENNESVYREYYGAGA